MNMDTNLNTNPKPMSLIDMTASRIQVLMSKSSARDAYQELDHHRPIYADNSSSEVYIFPKMMDETFHKRVALNVSGERHEVPWSTLGRFPCTRLGKLKDCGTHEELKEVCDDYNLTDNEYYFNWHPRSFNSILQYYRTGRLHVNGEQCALSFAEDLKYWGLDDSCLSTCCEGKHLQETEDAKEQMRNRFLTLRNLEEEDFGNHGCSKFQRCVWNILEKPESSGKAQVLRFISVTAIIATCFLTLFNMDGYLYHYPEDNPGLTILEIICMGWFAVEYLLRFLFAPNKCTFFAGILNIVDLFFILHYVLSIILFDTLDIIELTASFFSNVRVLIILKLARHLKNLRILGVTLGKSSKELGLLLLFLCIGIVTFSQLIFLGETNWYEERRSIKTAWDAFWWAAVAMTSTSVCGDKMCPQSPFGKVIAVACVLCGVIVITLPIPIIMNNFSNCYRMQRMRKLVVKRCKDKDRVPVVEAVSGREILSSTARGSVL